MCAMGFDYAQFNVSPLSTNYPNVKHQFNIYYQQANLLVFDFESMFYWLRLKS